MWGDTEVREIRYNTVDGSPSQPAVRLSTLLCVPCYAVVVTVIADSQQAATLIKIPKKSTATFSLYGMREGVACCR